MKAKVIWKDVIITGCVTKYSLEVECRGGTEVGICFAMKPGFRNHLRLLCKFNNVQQYQKKALM